MERNRTDEQTEAEAHAAEAEKNGGAARAEVSFGKFKDAASLLEAYNNLEAEFTRRSQRLRELEGTVRADKAEAPAGTGGERPRAGESAPAAKLMGGGAPVAAPPRRPRTIAEAGELARGMLEK